LLGQRRKPLQAKSDEKTTSTLESNLIEGFWIVQYEGLQGNGGGVVVFVRGHVFGGDSGSTYIGRYHIDGSIIQADIRIHNYMPGVGSIIGIEGDYDLRVNGKMEGKVMHAQGVPVDKGTAGMALKLTKVAALPT
jgi:hypothetical protein